MNDADKEGARSIGSWLSLAVEGVMRLVMALIALAGSGACAAYLWKGGTNWFGAGLGILVLGYFVVGITYPSAIERAASRLGQVWRADESAPIARPLERILSSAPALVIAGITFCARAAGTILKWTLICVGVALATGIAWFAGSLLFAGVAALPVSVAVIVGALIVASVIKSRG